MTPTRETNTTTTTTGGRSSPAMLSKKASFDNIRRTAVTPLVKPPQTPGRQVVKNDSSNVQVVLRIRPSFQPDQNIPARFTRTVVHPSAQNPHNEVVITIPNDGAKLAPGLAAGNKGKPTSFIYDQLLGEDCHQNDVYAAAGQMAVDKFISGMNVTMLAYGQTSSGKSYTMGTSGVDDDYQPGSHARGDGSDRLGMIPRAVNEIFREAEIKKRESGFGSTWECRLSFLELYNEELIDLLSNVPQAQAPPIVIREDKGRILWSGLREVIVNDTTEVMSYLKAGSYKRRTGETGMNKESSRSHAIFSLSLFQRKKVGGGGGKTTPGPLTRPVSTPAGTMTPTSSARTPTPTGIRTPARSSMIATRTLNGQASGRASPSMNNNNNNNPSKEDDSWVELSSKLHFVDLAGSERLKRTEAGGDRMREGISINSGLTALGNVISALSDPKAKTSHIPYRDSKLTRLLQDSVGGNAFTVMIACVSPIEYNLSETLNTLKYGARARNIKNRAQVNQVEVGWNDVEHLQSTVLSLRSEVERLKKAPSSPEGMSEHVDGGAEAAQRELRAAKAIIDQLEAEHHLVQSLYIFVHLACEGLPCCVGNAFYS